MKLVGMWGGGGVGGSWADLLWLALLLSPAETHRPQAARR